jgi:hypothetical protein
MTPRKRDEYHQVIDKYAEALKQCTAVLEQVCPAESAQYQEALGRIWDLCGAYIEFDRLLTGDAEIDAYIQQALGEAGGMARPVV